MGYFGKIIYRQELSKMAQSDHTGTEATRRVTIM